MFDVKKFSRMKFTPRTEDVSVPDMQAFFPDGDKAVWTVRGLTGQELGQANEASDRQRNIAAVVSGIASGASKDVAESINTLLGISKNTPADVAKRIEHLCMGSVAPVCTQDLAVKICEVYPVEFYQITNTILKLTGQGQMPGKLPPSGATRTSGPASPSDMPGGDSSTS
jgi:hypothetical protein